MGSIVMTEIKVDNIVNVAGTGKPNFPVSPTHSTGSALSTLNRYQYDTTTRVVTVVSDGGNKYAIDGVTTPTITLLRGVTYTFDVSDSSNSNHPLAFKNAGTSYTTGITSSGTAGTAGATVTFAVAANAPLTGLTYYCTVHGDGMGSSVTTSDPNNGAMLWDGTNVNFYLDSAFKPVSAGSGSSGSSAAAYGARGMVLGGENSSSTRQTAIDYFDITYAGNAADFGDLTVARYESGSGSNGSRGICMGGDDGTGSPASNHVDYWAFATLGNAVDFGDMFAGARLGCGAHNTIRALYAGGRIEGQVYDQNRIEYVTIATTGNGSDFGNLTAGFRDNSGTANETRAVFGGGYYDHGSQAGLGTGAMTNILEYVTIATTGDSTDFGDLTRTKHRMARGVITNGTRGAFCGGVGGTADESGGGSGNSTFSVQIQYITIDTTGNATDAGDLTRQGYSSAATGDGTYGCTMGNSDNSNVIDRFTIATTANAADHGDLVAAKHRGCGISGAAS